MRTRLYADQQIPFALPQAAGGTPVPEVCRKVGVSAPTFYTCKQKYGVLVGRQKTSVPPALDGPSTFRPRRIN